MAYYDGWFNGYPAISLLAQRLSKPSSESTLLQSAQNRARRQANAFARSALNKKKPELMQEPNNTLTRGLPNSSESMLASQVTK